MNGQDDYKSFETGVYIEQAKVCLQILTMGMPSDTDSY